MTRRLPDIEASVLRRARRGDGEAHAEIYRVLAPVVYTLARRICASAALAEDVLQETFVEVICNLKSCRDDRAVAAWIRRIAVNKCLMHLRSPWISRRLAQVDPDDTADGQSGNADDRIAVARAFSELPDTARAVVWLHDVEGYTHREIAELMKRTPSFSKSQLARAHERLRRSLEGNTEVDETELCAPELKTC